jgi:hypothetical protein
MTVDALYEVEPEAEWLKRCTLMMNVGLGKSE